MLTLIAASLATVPAAQPAPANPHAQHAQQQSQQQAKQPHKMDGCCCCKDMAGKHDCQAMAPKAEEHKGH